MTERRYDSPNAFKQALEQRLRTASAGGAAFTRKRQRLVFERFLARIATVLGNAVTLKGGLVLELRLARARATNDVDLRMVGSPVEVLERLQRAGNQELGDFLRYDIAPDPSHPVMTNPGMRYEGMRFRAACTLAGKPYGQPFGVDVAFGEPMYGEPELLVPDNLLVFAELDAPPIRVYPLVTHIAEKLHAYTLPRDRPNSRIKDLPDLALLASVRALDAADVRNAIEQTFAFRATHPRPSALPMPSASWEAPYAAMARSNQLLWTTLHDVTTAAQAFLDPLLALANEARWDPQRWTWSASGR